MHGCIVTFIGMLKTQKLKQPSTNYLKIKQTKNILKTNNKLKHLKA